MSALKSEQAGVRAAAADALGHIGSPAKAAIPHLVQRFQDDDHAVRYRAVAALDAMGPQAAPAVAELVALILDSRQREPARQLAIMTIVRTLPGTRDEVVKGLVKASPRQRELRSQFTRKNAAPQDRPASRRGGRNSIA